MTTANDIIKRLAELPCPHCQGTGDIAPVEQRQCGACRGTGARLWWLRLPHDDHTIAEASGWVPRYDISLEDALVELTNFGYEWNVHHDAGTFYVGMKGTRWITRRGPNLMLALWQALEKAVNDVQ